MKTVVITAGSTKENLDSACILSQPNNGMIAAEIADMILEQSGWQVVYIHSKDAIMPKHSSSDKFTHFVITDAMQLEAALGMAMLSFDVNYLFHAMSVFNYTVEYISTPELIRAGAYNFTSPSATLSNTGLAGIPYDNILVSLKRRASVIESLPEKEGMHLVLFKYIENVCSYGMEYAAVDALKNNDRCSMAIACNSDGIGEEESQQAYIVSKSEEAIFQYKCDTAKSIEQFTAMICAWITENEKSEEKED